MIVGLSIFITFLYLCWITGGHTIHQSIERLLPSAGIELTPFHNSISRVAGLQVHAPHPTELFPVSTLKATLSSKMRIFQYT